MISLYTGTPGSGKSLDLARIILNRINSNMPVITNFDIKLPKRLKNKQYLLTVKYDSDVSVEFLIDYANKYFLKHKFKESQILYVIDEAQLMFNSRSWSTKGRDNWIKFFSNHRHLGYDVIMCCQFDLMIDKQIRSLVEYHVIHRKINQLGWKGHLLQIFMFAPQLFVRVKVWYPMNEKVDSMFYRYNPKYKYIYDSYTSNFAEVSLEDLGVDK